MKSVLCIAFLMVVVDLSSSHAGNQCDFKTKPKSLVVKAGGAKLVVRLEDPPRTRVTLSLDSDSGQHSELTWDPAVNDGLRHDVLLSSDVDESFRISAFVEEDRAQAGQMILTNRTTFERDKTSSRTELILQGSRTTTVVSAGSVKTEAPSKENSPRLVLECQDGAVEMSALKLDVRRVSSAIAARGLLDQAVPTAVTETLTLLAEIAVERAKAGALELVRSRFVDPICNMLDMETLHIGVAGEMALPRTCQLLRSLRLEDILSTGRNLVDAVRDDVRLQLAPALISRLGLPQEAIKIGVLGLDLANRLVDDGQDKGTTLDLLMTLLDRVVSLSGLEYSLSVTLDWITSAGFAPDVYGELLRGILPEDPGAWLDEAASKDQRQLADVWKKIPDCTRSPGRAQNYFIPASKASCIASLRTTVDASWVRKMIDDKVITLEALIQAARRHATKQFSDWVAEKGIEYVSKLFQQEALQPQARIVLERGCAARVVIGVVKWCSGREACAVGEVANVLEHPETVFKKASSLPDSLCWESIDGPPAAPGGAPTKIDRMILPRVRQDYIQLAAQAVGFLNPPGKGEEQARALALVRWMFDLALTLDDNPAHVKALRKFREIVVLLTEHDYIRALSQAIDLATEHLCTPSDGHKCEMPTVAKRSMNFIGAIMSYLQVYKETSGKDVAEAKAARRKALESLIDASTDRKERADDWIFSLGIPVGVTVGERWTRDADDNFGTPGEWYGGKSYVPKANSFSWRLPLAIGMQSSGNTGLHAAVTFIDLGNFLRNEGGGDDLHWNDFLSFGGQVGLFFGDRRHVGLLALDFSWSPTVNEQTTDAGATTKSGAFLLGLTAAYYVPIFDLN